MISLFGWIENFSVPSHKYIFKLINLKKEFFHYLLNGRDFTVVFLFVKNWKKCLKSLKTWFRIEDIDIYNLSHR